MKINIVLRYCGLVLLLNAAFMLLSAFISMVSGMDSGFYPLLLSGVLTGVLGGFPLIFVEKGQQISSKEGYVIVVGSWLLACVVSMFPFLIWGGEFSLVNAWFESVSGCTTTGATILNDIEALPRGLLFWRSSTHWIGGIGLVMFALVILPSIGNSRMTLKNMELSSMAQDNYRYRTQKIIQILLVVYVGFTIIETLLLKVAGMNWFDAVNHAFSNIATGGFSTRNMSIGYYDNPWIETIVIIFAVLSGVHFGLIFATVTGKANNMFRSEVVRYYLATIAVCSIIIAVSLIRSDIYRTFGESLRHSLFQVVCLITTTGFATADTTTWTPVAIILLVFVSLQCSCAGSTSGGLKCDRVYLAAKAFGAKLRQQQHPNAIIRIKLNNFIQDPGVVHAVMLYIVAYFSLILIDTLFNAACGLDLTTSFTAAIACAGNVGPGFGEVGSASTFAAMPAAAKVGSTVMMLLGRLEIFGLFQLFLIKWWR